MPPPLPSWVNVVLEGGGLTLERALVAYRQLTAHLKGDWRAHAPEVHTLTLQILEHEAEVKDLEARALRRSALSEMVEVDRLAKAVTSARAALISQLSLGEEPFHTRLRALEAEASDEAFLHRAWERFRLERFIFSWASITLLAFLTASAVQAAMTTVRFLKVGADLRAPEPFDWIILLIAVPFTIVAWFRFAAWEWLGMRAPQPLGPLVASSLAIAACTALGQSKTTSVTIACGVLVSTFWGQLAWRMWHPRSEIDRSNPHSRTGSMG